MENVTVIVGGQEYLGNINTSPKHLVFNGTTKIPAQDEPAMIEVFVDDMMYDFIGVVQYVNDETRLHPLGMVGVYTKDKYGNFRTARYFLEGGC